MPAVYVENNYTHFPQQEESGSHPTVQQNVLSVSDLTDEELWAICGRIGDAKAPVQYGVTNKAIKLAVKARSE